MHYSFAFAEHQSSALKSSLPQLRRLKIKWKFFKLLAFKGLLVR